jgi:hypothetical protein
MGVWVGFIWFKVVSSGSCEHGNELTGCIKDGELITQLGDY